jgi:hypothetical protein
MGWRGFELKLHKASNDRARLVYLHNLHRIPPQYRQTVDGTCPRFPFAAVDVFIRPYLTIVVRFAENFATFEDVSDSASPDSCSKCLNGGIAAVH